MRLLVLGAGGVGGYFGGRLAQSGVDVTFLVRAGRRQQLERDGLRIESELGDLHLAVKTVEAPEVRAGYDMILLTCKAYDLDSAIDAIAPAVGGTGVVVPLLNGLEHLDRLDDRFGRAHVMGGTCHIDVTLGNDGIIHHGGRLQRLTFGTRDPLAAAVALMLAEALARTTIDWVQVADIEQHLWEKLVFLAALASGTCLFRANVREIMASPGGRETMERALLANIDIATREGHPPSQAAVAFARRRLTDPGPWSASMLRDLEGGGQVESDHIIGWLLDKARAHGIDDTILALTYTHLKAYEARRAAARLPNSR